MGAGRSVVELIKKYQDLSNFHQGYEPPTLTDSTIYTWSSRYRWMERAAEYDETWEQRKNAEREHVFNQELALDFERVRKLVRLATMLEGQIYERGVDGILHNVWQPDRKSIGTFPVQEFVDIERFNSALISEYRATLDDLAKEVGGRKQKTEVTGADGKPIQTQQTNVNLQAESAHDANNILKQLAELGAIPPEPGTSDNNTATE